MYHPIPSLADHPIPSPAARRGEGRAMVNGGRCPGVGRGLYDRNMRSEMSVLKYFSFVLTVKLRTARQIVGGISFLVSLPLT